MDARTPTPLCLQIPKNAPTFVFKRPNGNEVVYNLETLVDYCLATGNFTEPETRIEFTEVDLKCIDAQAQACGLERESLLAAKRDPERYTAGHFRVDAINGLERCAGELVAEMAGVIEGDDPEGGQMRLVMYIFPLFASYYNQIKDADADYATMCMKHFTLYIEGPPNRPTNDRYGFIPIILQFFHQVCGGGCGGSSDGGTFACGCCECEENTCECVGSSCRCHVWYVCSVCVDPSWRGA